MAEFSESLENKANQILKDFDLHTWDNSIPSILKREIALTTDCITQLRQFHKKQIYQLNEIECDLGTELMQMEDRTPKYSPHRFPEREKFNRQLIGIKHERSKQDALYDEKMMQLRKTVLDLIHKYEQVKNINNEPRQDFRKAGTFDARPGRSLA